MSNHQPDIQIVNANLKGSRELTLQYTERNQFKLHSSSTSAVVKHIQYLWGYSVNIEEVIVL